MKTTVKEVVIIYILVRPLFSLPRWMDNIKMDLLEIGLNVVDWTVLAQDRYR
jgi:hypothetical protein